MISAQVAQEFLSNLSAVWTFMLLVVRYTGFFFSVPGLGEGIRGVAIRFPAVIVFAFASLHPQSYAEIPSNAMLMAATFVCELMLGMLLGVIPLIIVNGVQMAAQLASTSMGLGAAQLFDPGLGGSQSDLGRIIGDLTIVVFLLLGGHHVVIFAVSGLGGKIVAGSFVMGEVSITLLIQLTSEIFRMGVMLSAPVIVALLLTQFIMGMISKAVPTVNIFIVSFPLTIAIGLLLSVIALPDMVTFMRREFSTVEKSVLTVFKEAHEVSTP